MTIRNTKLFISPSDRISSTLPSNISLNLDVLHKTVGFQNIQKVITHYKETAMDNLHIQYLGRDPIHDRGIHAMKPKKQSNKKPLQIPDDDVWHYDIAYGIGTSIGGIKYALVITGRANRYTFLYPLTDMKDTIILLAMKHFVAQLGRKPRKMYADRDFKLIGEIVSKYLKTNEDTNSMETASQVAGAPSGRQNQNGLAEIHWKTLLDLFRNRLASN